jgi:hypothetical protein
MRLSVPESRTRDSFWSCEQEIRGFPRLSRFSRSFFSRKTGRVKAKTGLFALIALFTLFFLENDGYGERKETSTLSYPPPLAEISVDSLVAGW